MTLPHRTPVHERETVAAYEGVDPLWLARLEDGLRSLRSLTALVAIIALAALGLSIYGLIHDSDDRRGASQARVAALSDRVNRLEGRTSASVDNSASRISEKASRQDVQDLSDEVSQLRSAVRKSGSGDAALTQLNTRVDRLTRQVADLQSADTSSQP